MRFAPIIAIVFAFAACQQKTPEQPPTTNGAAASPEGVGVKGVHRDHKGQAAPGAVFADPEGKPAKLGDFKGKPLLVNLWATWCAPCVKELPTLDELASSGAIEVLAVSQDMDPQGAVDAFLSSKKVGRFAAYHDPDMALSGALGPDTVLPTSILYDAGGKEVWRYVGDLDWTSPEAAKLLSEAGASPRKG